MAKSLIRGNQKPERPAVPPPPPDLPLTPLHLAAIEALRRRDGITRAGAAARVRVLPEADLQALVDAAASPAVSSPVAPRRESSGGDSPPPQEQQLQPAWTPAAEAACDAPVDDDEAPREEP